MKKLLALFSVCVILLSALTVGAAATILYGDANGDGKINNKDIGLLQQYLADWDVVLGPTDGEGTNKPGNEPAANSELSVKDAISLALSKEHSAYTQGKYYVTGKIAEIYDTTWGNMKITATDGKGDQFTIYGTYDAAGKLRFDDMKTQPKVGDIVKMYGVIGQFADTAQMKNGRIMEINGKATVENVTQPTEIKLVTDQDKILKETRKQKKDTKFFNFKGCQKCAEQIYLYENEGVYNNYLLK